MQRKIKMKYKSYREQCLECDENGNRTIEDCPFSTSKLLICKKYGGQCISSKCKNERMIDEP